MCKAFGNDMMSKRVGDVNKLEKVGEDADVKIYSVIQNKVKGF